MEVQIKTMRFYFIPVRMSLIPKFKKKKKNAGNDTWGKVP